MGESNAPVTSRVPSTDHLLPRVLLCFLALLPLYLLIRHYDQIFHTVLEIAIITVAVAVFSVGWHAHSLARNDSLLVIAVGFLIVAALDLLHTLSYQGVLPGSGENLSNQLWAASGLMEGLCLLIAAVLGKERLGLRPFAILLAWLTAGGMLTAAITPLALIPDFYRPQIGHTPFNTGAKGFNLLLLLLAAWLFVRRRRQFPPYTGFLLALAAGMQFISEANLFLRLDVSAFPGFIGHLTRFFGHILVFSAMIQGTLLSPYTVLFGNLSASERRLRGALAEAERNRDKIDVILRSMNDGLIFADTEHRIVLMNGAAETLPATRGSEAATRPVTALLPLEEQLSKALGGGEVSGRISGSRKRPETPAFRSGPHLAGQRQGRGISRDGDHLPGRDPREGNRPHEVGIHLHGRS